MTFSVVEKLATFVGSLVSAVGQVTAKNISLNCVDIALHLGFVTSTLALLNFLDQSNLLWHRVCDRLCDGNNRSHGWDCWLMLLVCVVVIV